MCVFVCVCVCVCACVCVRGRGWVSGRIDKTKIARRKQAKKIPHPQIMCKCMKSRKDIFLSRHDQEKNICTGRDIILQPHPPSLSNPLHCTPHPPPPSTHKHTLHSTPPQSPLHPHRTTPLPTTLYKIEWNVSIKWDRGNSERKLFNAC